jgi:putative membrane protein
MLHTILKLDSLAMVVRFDALAEVLVTTLIFVAIGIVFFAVAYAILSRMFNIHKEIEEDHNTALGLVIGSIMLGLALIIAAAING